MGNVYDNNKNINNKKQGKKLQTVIITIIVLIAIVGISNVIKNVYDEQEAKHGQKEAEEEINGAFEIDSTLQGLTNAANKASEKSEVISEKIGELVLEYMPTNTNATINNVEPLEMDNYGRCLYYVTVNINNGESNSKTYFYVVVYDINTTKGTFKYTDTAVVEDPEQTPIQKQYAKDYNDWNKKIK